VCEAEEGPKSLGKALNRTPGITAFADPCDERLVNVGDAQVLQGVPGTVEIVQEGLNHWAVSIDSPRRQTSFTTEVVGESVKVGGVRTRWCRR
jgi:hypothetical protein